MKPSPIKFRLSDSSNELYCKNQEIKRLKAEIDRLVKTLQKLDRELSGLRGAIKQAWDNGVATKDIM